MAPVLFNLVCFRCHPADVNDESKLNDLNEKLLLELNKSGKIYISHTKLNGKYTLRIVTGQTHVDFRHAREAWKLITVTAKQLR